MLIRYAFRIRSTPSPRILQSSVAAFALILSAATSAVAVPIGSPQKDVDLFGQRLGGSAVPGAGEEESYVAADAKFTGFGIPSINDNGDVAVLGRYKSPTDKGTVTAVFAGSPVAQIAKKGDVAPNALGQPEAGVVFSSFRDPLLSPTGRVAFIAKLAGESVTSSASSALFTNAFGGSLIRVIQAGDAAPGIPGATIRKITSVVIGGPSNESEKNTIFFTAALAIGGDAAVTRADDVVLYSVTEEPGMTITPVLREGQSVTIGSGPVTVKSFRALAARSGSAGQGRGVEHSNYGWGTVLITTTTGARVVTHHRLGFLMAFKSGEQANNYAEGTLWTNFGIPTQSSGNNMAFVGTVKGSDVTFANNRAIFAEGGNYALQRIVSKGDQAPGITDATFSSFKDPVTATGLRVAFAAKVKGAVSSADDQGVWFRGNNGLELVAREGAQPPGVPAGAQWASFTSLALSDGAGAAPMFVAKLVRPKAGESNPAGILSTNSTGLWARDASGNLHLIARYGETITVNGEEKPVRSFVALKSVAGSPAQNRYFNNKGEIYYRAICTDGTQALMRVALPGSPQ